MRHDADLIVVGGGLVGMLTALEAQRAGHEVCLIDKHFSESGDHAPSVLFSMGVPPEVAPIFKYSLQQWAELSESVEDPIGLNRNGVAFVGLTQQQVDQLDTYTKGHQGFSIYTDAASMAKALNIHQVGDGLKGVMIERDGFHIYSSMTHESLRRDLMQGGARIFGTDAVMELIIEKEKVIGIKTKHDEIYAKNVALCAGAWTGKLLKQFGLSLPIRPARSHRIELSVTGEMPKQPLIYPLKEGNIIVRPMRSGRVLVVYTGQMDQAQATWSHHIDHDAVKAILRGVARLVPALANAKVQNVETSTLAITPDLLPYLGRVASLDGLYVATGMNSQTFMYAPAVAKAVALLVSGKAPEVDMTPFSPDRYILKDMAQKAAETPEIEEDFSEEEARLREELKDLNPDEIEAKVAEAHAEFERKLAEANKVVTGKELADTQEKVQYAKLKEDQVKPE